MGVYIKGLEMPIAGMSIEIAENVDGKVYARLGYGLDDWHEVISVPAHGRLVDADELEETMDFALQQVNAYLDNLDADYYSAEYREMEARAQCYRIALEAIRSAPTVIQKEWQNREGHKKNLGKAQALPRRGTTDALLSFGESAKAKAARREVTRVRLIFAQGDQAWAKMRGTHYFIRARARIYGSLVKA